MDFGKEKFGGPFTEDIKTLLRLIPLLVCVSIAINAVQGTGIHPVREQKITGFVLNQGLTTWPFPVVLIPFYQLVRPLFRAYIPSMLKSTGFAGYNRLHTTGGCRHMGVVLSNGEHRYVTCAELPS